MEGKVTKQEPVLTVTAVTTAVAALLGLLVALGLDISDELQQQIITVIVACAPILMTLAVLLRQLVVSPETAAKLRDQAFVAAPSDPKPDLPILPATAIQPTAPRV